MKKVTKKIKAKRSSQTQSHHTPAVLPNPPHLNPKTRRLNKYSHLIAAK